MRIVPMAYRDPAPLAPAIDILAEALSVIADSRKLIAAMPRLLDAMKRTPGFHYESLLQDGEAPPRMIFVQYIDNFAAFLIEYNFACLKPAHTIKLLQTLATADDTTKNAIFDVYLSAITLIIDTNFRLKSGVATVDITGFSGDVNVPIALIAAEFGACFREQVTDDMFNDTILFNESMATLLTDDMATVGRLVTEPENAESIWRDYIKEDFTLSSYIHVQGLAHDPVAYKMYIDTNTRKSQMLLGMNATLLHMAEIACGTRIVNSNADRSTEFAIAATTLSSATLAVPNTLLAKSSSAGVTSVSIKVSPRRAPSRPTTAPVRNAVASTLIRPGSTLSAITRIIGTHL